MAYCNWSNFVNKVILDSSAVNVGDGATVQDSLESGGIEKSRLTCANPPDKFSVVMAFDFVEKLSNGYTEYENFCKWFKNVHKFGTVPFQFPAILINSNRQQGYAQSDIEASKLYDDNGELISQGLVPDVEFYKITSSIDGQKSGHSQEVKMTWKTYATGVIQAEEEEYTIDHIEPTNGTIDVIMTAPSEEFSPNIYTWNVTCTKDGVTVPVTITNCIYDCNRTATLFFEPFSETGTYVITVDDVSDIFVIGA